MSEIGRKGGHSSAGQRVAKSRQIQEGNGNYEHRDTELSGTNERTAVKATEVLRGDHRKVEALFAQYETATGEHSQKETLIKQICQELEAHTRLEEEIFYPIMQISLNEEGEQLIAEATNAHEMIKNIIVQLSSMIPGEASCDAVMQQLKQWVKHHVAEEEKEMLPKAEQQLSDQLESLGARLQQYKQRLQTITQDSTPNVPLNT
jgi:hemerythrin-like domain-containing protein